MPEWLWAILIGVVVVGLVTALRAADRERISQLEQWKADKEKTDREWRHDVYNQNITELQLDVRTLQIKFERVERAMNGYLKDHR